MAVTIAMIALSAVAVTMITISVALLLFTLFSDRIRIWLRDKMR